MQVKKDNNNKGFQNTSIDEGLIKISIKDGYQEGDTLNLDFSGVQYTWNSESKELLISTSIDNVDIYNILDNISLSSLENKEQQTGRFIEVEYVSKDGEVIPLREYVLDTDSIEDISWSDDFVETHESVDTSSVATAKEEVFSEESLSFDYEENIGADFLESSVEENLLYEINLKDDGDNGDIYKILKDSFTDMDTLEIHGYDISQDKVSLEEFTKEFGDSFNYSISADNDNLNVNIYVANQEYNVVLKDVVSDTDTALEDIIQNLIINNNNHKI